jgi:hypothetical protein
LNVAVRYDLDAVTPRVQEIAERSVYDRGPGGHGPIAHIFTIVYYKPEVPFVILILVAALAESKELVAHINKSHGYPSLIVAVATAQFEREDGFIKVERSGYVCDFERDMIYADQARFTIVGHLAFRSNSP